MSQNSRNPKDLRQIVADSSQDVEDMQKNLGKLRALSEDDKTENAKLRSRIDEQCQLIMILKQRADEGTFRIQALEKINGELLEFRNQADAMLNTEIRRYNLLDGRFNQLASNHEEMIRIKDEYKHVNELLRMENAKLKEENTKLFSKTVAEKDEHIFQLDKKCAALQDKYSSLEHKSRQDQVEWRGKEDTYRKQIAELHANNSQQLKEIQRELHATEERLKGAEYKLKQQLDSKHSLEEETFGKLQHLTREKEELLALVMQRGKLVQKEQDENKVLRKRIEEMEKAVRNMEDKFIREADAVNSNLRVKRLSEELENSGDRYSQMVKEFEAFKKHSSELLKKEKELNDRLRKLYA